jgi:hypothetical protein
MATGAKDMTTNRITQLKLSIREGEMRLQLKTQTGKSAIRTAIANSRTRIERLEAGLDEGRMVYDEQRGWHYEYEVQS